MKIAVANFKANLSETEARNWLIDFTKLAPTVVSKDKEIILCPPVIYLELFRTSCLQAKLPVVLGAQSVSQFSGGVYTGEVTAKMLTTYVQYVLIGHSEERKIRKLTTSDIQEKITLANQNNLKVILCAESPESYSGKISVLAYEPSEAISNAQGIEAAANPQGALQELKKIRAQQLAEFALYGGSVSPTNVSEYSRIGFDGVLVGKHSLNPQSFWEIVSAL
jgi:triosephosphate isomerase